MAPLKEAQFCCRSCCFAVTFGLLAPSDPSFEWPIAIPCLLVSFALFLVKYFLVKHFGRKPWFLCIFPIFLQRFHSSLKLSVFLWSVFSPFTNHLCHLKMSSKSPAFPCTFSSCSESCSWFLSSYFIPLSNFLWWWYLPWNFYLSLLNPSGKVILSAFTFLSLLFQKAKDKESFLRIPVRAEESALRFLLSFSYQGLDSLRRCPIRPPISSLVSGQDTRVAFGIGSRHSDTMNLVMITWSFAGKLTKELL